MQEATFDQSASGYVQLPADLCCHGEVIGERSTFAVVESAIDTPAAGRETNRVGALDQNSIEAPVAASNGK